MCFTSRVRLSLQNLAKKFQHSFFLLAKLCLIQTSSTCQSSEGEDMDNFTERENNAVDSMSPSY